VGETASTLPWYADGLRFTCTWCGNCCGGAPGYVWVSPQECRAIARRLGLSLEQFEQAHTRRVGLRRSLLELENGDCEFLVREPEGRTHCAIHPVRPVQCRTWPFWRSNVATQRAWEQSARHCPGINQGEHHTSQAIQEALRQNAEADVPL
jgi:Fe-S-cluster containining protein